MPFVKTLLFVLSVIQTDVTLPSEFMSRGDN